MNLGKLLACAAVALIITGCSPGLQMAPTGALPTMKGHLAPLVERSAARNDVPPELVHRIIRVESRGNCAADNGIAKGVMQVKPATARSVGITGNLKDCETGIEAGVRYLKLALDRASGDWAKAAKLYNAGIGANPRPGRYSREVLK